MQTRVFAAAIAAMLLSVLNASHAQARGVHQPRHHFTTQHRVHRSAHHRHFRHVKHRTQRLARGHCPASLGCGCNLADYFHITGAQWRTLWEARAWARVGTPAGKGCVGCVVVLRRGGGGHVGIVRAYDAHGNPVVYSYGNRRTGWHEAVYPARRALAYRQL